MIIIKTPDELVQMRESSRMAALVLDRVAQKVAPGVSTAELDDFAREEIGKLGAVSAFFNYRGYPGYICASINDEVVHGIPGTRKIRLGDVVSLDVGVTYGGFVGDTATTVMVGVSDAELIRLVRTGEEALSAAILKAVTGARLGDVCHAIESTAIAAGFSVVRDFVGHGVGRKMHEDPQIPNFGVPGTGPKLKTGMTLAIEPMINMGTSEVDVMPDGWTVRTKDRKPSVHFEHTIAVQEGSAEILTCVKKK
ncbi:MAG TPA: type I methionyl aminopeptidase [Verrucomicrobia bacterium]|nr:MAG: type I methionyl aminopeptidase [Lentisphaerae bacterium GWF2_57_35]HBA83571.1 type I methionyl aminopeptidase [Verrucomicrobiota bacterium]